LSVTVTAQTKSPPSTDLPVELTQHHRGPGFWQVTAAHLSLHTGSHIDSALHCFAQGGTTAEIPLDHVCGEAVVLDCTEVGPEEPVTVAALERARRGCEVRPGDILLVRTDWTDAMWGTFPAFFTRSPYLAPEAAQWLIAQQPKAVGFDFFEEYSARLPHFDSEDFVVHRLLLGHGLPLLEQVTHLRLLGRRRGRFFAPFWKIAGTEGAPARFFALLE
jgi:kynurenine formamidase